jgi:hypothetical protein
MTPLKTLAAMALTALLAGGAQATTSIRLETASPNVPLGGAFDVRIVADIDAADEIIGFGFDLSAPASIGLLGFTAGPGFADDPTYLAPLSDADGIRGASGGDLLMGPPVSGTNLLLGTLRLQGVANGPAAISLSADDLNFFYTEGLMPLAPGSTNFLPPVSGLSVVVGVPEPATGLSLVAGLGALAAWRRRRPKA